MNKPTSLRDLFEAAVALPPAERAAYLAQNCSEREQTAAVERMLEADQNMSPRLLDRPVDAMLERIGDAQPPPPGAQSGTRVGPFTVLDKLGEGGSSIVFRAFREQAGVKQMVALKLLRRGVYSSEEQRRFRSERLALAQLQHPGIARLIEGGITETGIPYIALELIDGKPITDYVQAKRLDVRHRLLVFAAACRAVEAAHRALIVHRDLKPSNVLVTRDGEVKLLDFGIAKLLDADLEDNTRTQHHAMTPAYAAPEQFNQGMITTATDVYALGVLLGEMMTGSRRQPADSHTPSSRISDSMTPGVLPAPLGTTRRQLRGDLDNIVMKATAYEPERRYASAGAFADDIERYLASEPVAAHPPSRSYRMRKFVGRHRGGVVTTTVFLLAIFVGLGVALWQAAVARTQAKRADAVQAFLVDVFQTNSSYQSDQVKARQTTAQQLLELGAQKIDNALTDAPEAKQQLLLLLGDMHADLGLDEDAARLYRKAVSQAQAMHGEYAIDAFDAQLRLADSLHSGNSDAEAKIVLEQAQTTLDRRRDNDPRRRAKLLDQFAQYYATRDLPLALDNARKAVLFYEQIPASSELAFALSRKARVEHQSGLDADAMASYEQAIHASRNIDGDSNPDLPRFYAELSELQGLHLDVVGGERNAREALRVAESIHGENHVDVVQCQMRLGRLLADTGRLQEGLSLLADAKREILELRGKDDGFHTPHVLNQNAVLLMRAGRIEDALDDVQEAIANRRRNRPGTIPLAQFLETAASIQTELGQFVEAGEKLEESQAIREKAGQAVGSEEFDGNISARIRLALAREQYDRATGLLEKLSAAAPTADQLDLQEIYNNLLSAEVAFAAGRYAGAIGLAQKVRRKIQTSPAAAYYQTLVSRADFIEGYANLLNGESRSALPLLRQALTERQEHLSASSPEIAEAQIALAECDLSLGNLAAARELAAAAAVIDSAHKELGPQYREPLKKLQAKLARLPIARELGNIVEKYSHITTQQHCDE